MPEPATVPCPRCRRVVPVAPLEPLEPTWPAAPPVAHVRLAWSSHCAPCPPPDDVEAYRPHQQAACLRDFLDALEEP